MEIFLAKAVSERRMHDQLRQFCVFSLDPCFPGAFKMQLLPVCHPQNLTPHEDGPHFGMVAPTFANVRHGWPAMEVALGIFKYHGEWKKHIENS